MIRDGGNGLRGKVVIVDSQVRVEPVDLVRDELARDEALGVCVASVPSRV